MRNICVRGAMFAVILPAVLSLAGCATVPYDSQLDSQLTSTESDFHTLTSGILSAATEIDLFQTRNDHLYDAELADAKKKITYAANSAAYDKVRIDIMNLRVRANANSGPTHTELDSAIGQIEANLFGDGSMRAIHMKQDTLSADYVRSEEKIIDTQLSALGTYVAVTKTGS
jgi:hypothetical protein